MYNRALILDINNLLYRTFFAYSKESIEILVGMCHHGALWSMLSFYKQYPADEIVIAFDDYSWRKAYTTDNSDCITHLPYKGHRRKNLTESEKEKFQIFDEHVNSFYEMLRDETSLLVLRSKYLEADDLIARYVTNNPDMERIIISSDKDYLQLLTDDSITLIDPATKTARTLEKWDNDPEYFMFEKCFRGDTSDNVMSAYPRVRSTKIKAAYTDAYIRENLMEHTFTKIINLPDGAMEERTFLTRDVFEENKLLMDLSAQPDVIKELMDAEIARAEENRNKFNYFRFLKFCSKHQLENIIKNIDEFTPLLSNRQRRG